MYIYRLNNLTFNDGTQVPLSNLTVLLGPNNSGKSQALRDISELTTYGDSNPITQVITSVTAQYPSGISSQEFLRAYPLWEDGDNILPFVVMLHHTMQGTHSIYKHLLQYMIDEPHAIERNFRPVFAPAFTLHLKTEDRLLITKTSPGATSEQDESNLMQAFLSAGHAAEEQLSSQLQSAFGMRVKLDYSVPVKLCFRVANSFEDVPPAPGDARKVLRKYPLIDNQGDGVRSFVGVTAALLCLNRAVNFIDEPEAFLHPPQAFRMGEFLAQQASNQKQVILATHSADILRGILSQTSDVTLVRLDRRGNKGTYNILEPNLLAQLLTDPLLSSARVIEGLFHADVAVVEADADARFYGAVSRKLDPSLDLHFVNAMNKQTVPRVLKLYRSMGVRSLGILDFDLLNDSDEFQKQLEAANVAAEHQQELLVIQKSINTRTKSLSPLDRLTKAKAILHALLANVDAMDPNDDIALERLLKSIDSKGNELIRQTKAWAELKAKGREALTTDLQSAFDKLYEVCTKHGLFINPKGELETMMIEWGLPYSTNKAQWIVQALQFLSGLQVVETKHPWTLLKHVHEYLKTN